MGVKVTFGKKQKTPKFEELSEGYPYRLAKDDGTPMDDELLFRVKVSDPDDTNNAHIYDCLFMMGDYGLEQVDVSDTDRFVSAAPCVIEFDDE